MLLTTIARCYRRYAIHTCVAAVAALVLVNHLLHPEETIRCAMCLPISIPSYLLSSEFSLSLTITIIASLMPLAAYEYASYRRISRIEDQVPTALRMIVDSIRSGATLEMAFSLVSRSGLRPLSEIFERALALHRLRNVPLTEALTAVGRESGSQEVVRLGLVLDTSMRYGARVEDVLSVMARSCESVAAYVREKSASLRPYVVVAYVTVIVSALLYSVVAYVPMALAAVESRGAQSLPLPIATSFVQAEVERLASAFQYVGIAQSIAVSLIVGRIVYGRPARGLIHGISMCIIITALNYAVIPYALATLLRRA